MSRGDAEPVTLGDFLVWLQRRSEDSKDAKRDAEQIESLAGDFLAEVSVRSGDVARSPQLYLIHGGLSEETESAEDVERRSAMMRHPSAARYGRTGRS